MQQFSKIGFSFWDRQLELLGDQDPLRVLSETPFRLAGIVAEHPGGDFERTALEGKWTPKQILGHLVDVEWIFGFRTRTIRFDEAPVLQGIDQEKWVENQGRHHLGAGELVSQFGALRDANLQLFREFQPSDLKRTGRHGDADIELSLELMLKILAGHDLSHLGQLRSYLKIIAES